MGSIRLFTPRNPSLLIRQCRHCQHVAFDIIPHPRCSPPDALSRPGPLTDGFEVSHRTLLGERSLAYPLLLGARGATDPQPSISVPHTLLQRPPRPLDLSPCRPRVSRRAAPFPPSRSPHFHPGKLPAGAPRRIRAERESDSRAPNARPSPEPSRRPCGLSQRQTPDSSNGRTTLPRHSTRPRERPRMGARPARGACELRADARAARNVRRRSAPSPQAWTTARPFPSLAHLGVPHERAARPCRAAGSAALVLWSGTSSVQADYDGMHGARARCEWGWGWGDADRTP